MEAEHSRAVHALGERVKELRLLYAVTEAVRTRHAIPALLFEIVGKIPAAWQYPEITHARIRIDQQNVETPGFRESLWRQVAAIRTGDRQRGSVEVHYAEARPSEVEGPFLAEERDLIDALARVLGEALAHREAAEELRQHRESLEELVESRTRALELARHALDRAGEAALWIDLDGKFFDVNEQACLLLGYTREELLLLGPVNMIEGFTPEIVKSRFSEIAEAGGSQTTERTGVRKDGSRLPVEIITSVSEFHGKRFALALVRDITERKRAAAELEAARVAAEAANRAKSAFLAHMSHEIRTPMNAVLGFAQLLQRDPTLAGGHRKHVDTILTSGEHLLGIINDVLEMSKIEAGHVQIEPVSFDVRILIADLESMFKERARAKGLAFVVEALAGIPTYLSGDQVKIRQIVVNLLGNSLKFTKSGTISLRVRSAPRADERFDLCFEVEDTGVGIAAEDFPLLFREFQQAEAGRSASGSGLGLAISRRYARLMSGDVTVKSKLGEGSTFTAVVAVGRGSPEAAPPGRSPRKIARLLPHERPARVLVVDDHTESRAFLRDLLRDVGYQVVEAANGREALALVEESPPDAILLDINMPEMSGLEMLKRLRESAAGRNVAVVVVSASVLDDAERAAVTVRSDAFVRKPVDASELLEIVGSRLDLPYVYEDEDSPLPARAARQDLGQFLRALEADAEGTLNELRRAAESANARRLRTLLDDIEPKSPVLVGELKRWLESYDYDALLGLLAEHGKKQT